MTSRLLKTVVVLAMMLSLGLYLGCDSEPPSLDTADAIVQCDAFDIRCLPCEAAGEGAPCEVHGSSGLCADMRIIQGPQVYIAGMRCNAD
jgi:hypothetical protein